mgnify:FL=1
MQLQESFSLAISTIKGSKLRSTLTLLGISVGVFSIIGVMSSLGVLQNAIESSLSELGSNTFQIQKFDVVEFGPPDLNKRNRKNITFEDGEEFIERMKFAKSIALESWFGQKQIVNGKKSTNPNISITGEMPEGFITNNFNLETGRIFTNDELRYSNNVTVIGKQVIDKLFPFEDPIGKEIKIEGIKYKVIGTLKSKGGLFGGNQDNIALIPLTTGLNQFGSERSLNIMVQTKSRETYDEAIEYAKSLMRIIREVPFDAEDDFVIFSNETMIKEFNDLTFIIKIGVLGISCIALLAAGIGIMNIMLVSVTERTKEIGIRKAIGATKKHVLTQFLTESVIFSQIGGVIGIIGGTILGNIVSVIMGVPLLMPWDTTTSILQIPYLNLTPLGMNILAIVFCSFIGILFGVYPAWKAANLDPIEALRYE